MKASDPLHSEIIAMPVRFTASSTLLFIGDSITDCGWRQDEKEQIGSGYVRLVRDWLCASDPSAAPRVVNRGISGNKMPDLQKRWERDVLAYRPDVVSVFIGINDVWHGLLPGREGCDIDAFLVGYRHILSQTRQSLPDVTIVLCEPSVLWLPVPKDADDRLLPYVSVVHEVAREFSAACVVPLHDAFNRSRTARPDIAWTTDGVHPTSTGHALIAREWLSAATGCANS